MRRRQSVLALVLALAAALVLSPLLSSGCKRKPAPAPVRGRLPLPVTSPYHPPPVPTVIWPTPRPGQPTRRPTLPG